MVTVVPVSSWEQFRDCLKLRFKVYCQLGFVDPREPSDLDEFDWVSLHFAAIDAASSVIGTVRLIIETPANSENSSDLEESRHWFRRACKLDGRWPGTSTTLPVLKTIGENSEFLHEFRSQRPGELSRIIVDPRHRGKGISHRLSNAVVRKAKDLNCDTLYLQCLPDHEKLFESFGFESFLRALHYSFLTVPEPVVAMRRRLNIENHSADGTLYDRLCEESS